MRLLGITKSSESSEDAPVSVVLKRLRHLYSCLELCSRAAGGCRHCPGVSALVPAFVVHVLYIVTLCLDFCSPHSNNSGGSHAWVLHGPEGCAVFSLIYQLPITNYQIAPSKRGAGGGSATHKEPT